MSEVKVTEAVLSAYGSFPDPASSTRVSVPSVPPRLRVDANQWIETTLGAPHVDRVQCLGKRLALTSGSAGVNDPTVHGVLDEERAKRCEQLVERKRVPTPLDVHLNRRHRTGGGDRRCR